MSERAPTPRVVDDKADWIELFDPNSPGDPATAYMGYVRCARCKTDVRLASPLELDIFTGTITTFAKVHRKCRRGAAVKGEHDV
jgi:hypothetical protein